MESILINPATKVSSCDQLRKAIIEWGFDTLVEDQQHVEYRVQTDRDYYLNLMLWLTDRPFVQLNSGCYSKDVEVPLVRQFYVDNPEELKFVLLRTRSFEFGD